MVAIDDRVFLRGMYEAGIESWVDGIGAHPYGFANPPDESWDDPAHVASSHNDHPSFFFRDTLEDYHAIMLAYGDTGHQIWVTEFGWPSTEGMGPGVSEDPSRDDRGVSEDPSGDDRMDTTGWEYALQVVMTGIACGLKALHRAGIIRRELSPRFVLLREADDRPILMDLELAKLSEGVPTVSPQEWPEDPYRAIEVGGDAPIDARADLYSWGRIFVA